MRALLHPRPPHRNGSVDATSANSDCTRDPRVRHPLLSANGRVVECWTRRARSSAPFAPSPWLSFRTARPTTPKALLFGPSAAGGIFVCDMPGSNWIMRPIVPPADLSQTLVKPAAGCKRKKWPRKTGAIGPNHRRPDRPSDRACSWKFCIFRGQRPKRGRSPLRMAMRLLAVSRRSMEAIRRPNRVLEGRRPMDAVLDMFVPFLGAEPFRFVISEQFMYTRCQRQQVCLHSSNCSGALQQN